MTASVVIRDAGRPNARAPFAIGRHPNTFTPAHVVPCGVTDKSRIHCANDQPQLRPLVVLSQRIARDRISKPGLRADCEAIVIDLPRRLLSAPRHRHLRTDKAEHHAFGLRYEA